MDVTESPIVTDSRELRLKNAFFPTLVTPSEIITDLIVFPPHAVLMSTISDMAPVPDIVSAPVSVSYVHVTLLPHAPLVTGSADESSDPPIMAKDTAATIMMRAAVAIIAKDACSPFLETRSCSCL